MGADGAPDDLQIDAIGEGCDDRAPAEIGQGLVFCHAPRVARAEDLAHPLPEVGLPHPASVPRGRYPPGVPLVVRVAEDSDLPGVGEVDAASRLHAYTGLLDQAELAGVTPQAQTQVWSERVARERDTHVMLVAQLEGRVVGYSYVGPGEDPQIGDLYALFVHPDVYGTGVAQRLLDESLSVLRGFGYQMMLLWVLEGNDRAIRFYEKSGWRHDGTRRVGRRGAVSLRYLYP